ncbi:MAG: glycosyltransferase family A protein [Dermatophilus congolensis]|nr:glycosyltransferase family A protein [Dermatophilus congolensis]
MPRLSVIMPVLDGERYLPQTLASLEASLPRDAELRVMDDGSTDSTPRLLAEVAERDRRFIVHRHEKPAGVAASLNELAEAGDSEHIARMDGDDIVMRHRFSIADFALRKADFAFTSVVFIDADGKIRGADQPGRFSPAAVPYHLTFGCMLVHPTVTMRRSVFDALGGYADTRAEDYELWMRAAASGARLVRTALPGLRYRRHSGQVTARSPWLAEDEDSPLYPAFGALLDHVLGHRPDGWKAVFASALGASELSPDTAAHTTALHREVVEAARSVLTPADLALLKWRASREARRIRARTRA